MSESTPPVDMLQALELDGFSIPDLRLQCLSYNLKSLHLFPETFLSDTYVKMREARILQRMFCGMTNLSHDGIVSFLSTKSVFAAVKWSPDLTKFHTLGIGFISQWIGMTPPAAGPRSAFAAYGFLPPAWGTEDAEILAMLGLARMFQTYGLRSIYGQRYSDNRLTATFMAKFGFRDQGEIPEFMLRQVGDEMLLVPGTVSRLSRQDFTHYVEQRLISLLEKRGGT